MRLIYSALVLGALGACAPAIPDSAAGVGFDNSPAAQQRREAQLAGPAASGSTLIPPKAVSSETLPSAVPLQTAGTASAPATGAPLSALAPQAAVPTVPPTGASDTSEDIARDTAAALAAAQANSGVPPVEASPLNPPPAAVSPTGISSENDFAAVSSTRTIESDAERLARNKAQYQQVPAAPLPSRSGDAQPNIVSYALSTQNARGTRLYSRSGFNLEAKAARNCAAFTSPDQAQIAFLSSGGPEKDKRGLDPDGDGFACAWDPTPFRRAVQN